MPLDDLVNAEPRKGLSLTRHEQGDGLVAVYVGCQPLQQFSSFRPERTTSPLIALPVKTHAQRPVEINIFDFQVSHLLRSRSGVIEHHEESPVTQCKDSIARQGPEEGLNFVVFQV
jgi:hypothetical protein